MLYTIGTMAEEVRKAAQIADKEKKLATLKELMTTFFKNQDFTGLLSIVKSSTDMFFI